MCIHLNKFNNAPALLKKILEELKLEIILGIAILLIVFFSSGIIEKRLTSIEKSK